MSRRAVMVVAMTAMVRMRRTEVRIGDDRRGVVGAMRMHCMR